MSTQEKINGLSSELVEKFKLIKAFIVDADGILTDGKLYYVGEQAEGFMRSFHALDGFGFKALKKAGLFTGIISGGESKGLQIRAQQMKCNFIYLGNEDKREAYLDILKKSGLKDENILYMGDELFDIPLLKKAGIGITVPHASDDVKKFCEYVTERSAGTGCVREVIDIIRAIQRITLDIPDFEN